MITREQVADLKPGDVVELSWVEHEATVIVRGPLSSRSIDTGNGLFAGNYCARDEYGHPIHGDRRTLTVVSRAPRPLYVNHHRTEPVNGDVVRDDQTSKAHDIWYWWEAWWTLPGTQVRHLTKDRTLRLLVDGETGMTVPE